ncbi:MAG: ATP-grasp domain-containing protein [Candidatus Rokuibacteriota bacterium]
MPDRALIIDQSNSYPLQVCRALARRGCVVDAFAEAAAPVLTSRFCSRRIVSPPWFETEAFATLLASTLDAGQYDVVYLCSEVILERTIAPAAGARRWKGLPLTDPEALTTLFSKNAVMERVAAAGVPVPRTVVPADDAEVERLAATLPLPIVVKGEKGEAAQNVRVVRRRDDVVPRYRAIKDRERNYQGRPALQEFIPGTTYLVGGVFDRGRALRICAQRKAIMFPPGGGATVKGVTERPPELIASALAAFAALRYTGIGSLDFIQDARDGRFKFLEINPRVWASIGLGQRSVDLFGAYRDLAHGLPPAPDLAYREGLAYHRISGELRVIAREPTRLPGFLKDCLDPRVASDFDWTDPRPHLRPGAFTRMLARWTARGAPRSLWDTIVARAVWR